MTLAIAFILASIIVTALLALFFRVGAPHPGDLTDDEIMAMGDPRLADVLNAKHNGDAM